MVTPYYDSGGITIYHGDAREILPLVKADVMVTDPPYGMDYQSGWGAGHAKIVGDDGTASCRKPCGWSARRRTSGTRFLGTDAPSAFEFDIMPQHR